MDKELGVNLGRIAKALERIARALEKQTELWEVEAKLTKDAGDFLSGLGNITGLSKQLETMKDPKFGELEKE